MRCEFHDASECSFECQFSEGQEIAIPASVLVYADKFPCFLRYFDEFICLCGSRHKWLFDEDVFSGFEGGFCEGVVRFWGCGYDDDVD